ncbi:hypothetical protein Goarm_014257, partial [Gossypium armourianum]|nr:hypothetical protein [Gossypium armourianum]
MVATRFDIEKFDSVTNYNLWQTLSAIQLYLVNRVLQEVLMDKISSTLWK